jgi:CRISPR system Cascade subunit CasA
MKQNRARCWYDGKMPVPVIEDEKTAAAHADRSRRMVSAAERISGNVVTCLKEAWFSNPQNKGGDVSFVETAFWTGSEGAFFTHLNRLAGELDNPPDPSRPGTESLRAWHNHLCTFALRIFDEYALSGPIEDQDPARIARARNKLRHWNRGKKIKVDILRLPEDQDVQQTTAAGGQA